MNLRELVDRLALEVCAAEQMLDTEVTGGYASDLLSYVMARAKEGVRRPDYCPSRVGVSRSFSCRCCFSSSFFFLSDS